MFEPSENETPRFAVRADRFGVIEAEIEPDALIEQALYTRLLRGDLVMVRAKSLEERRARPVCFAHIDGGHRVDHLHRHGRHRHWLFSGKRGSREKCSGER
jgi:hypothetical protein